MDPEEKPTDIFLMEKLVDVNALVWHHPAPVKDTCTPKTVDIPVHQLFSQTALRCQYYLPLTYHWNTASAYGINSNASNKPLVS